MHKDPDTGIIKPRAKGLILPSATDDEFAKSIPPFAADFKVIPMREWGDYLQGRDKVHMRPFCGRRRKDQDAKGSCAGEGLANNGEAASEFAGVPWPDLNPWPLYYVSSGGVDRGSTLVANIKVMTERGCPSEAVWPRTGRNRHAWNERLSEEAREDALRHRIVRTHRLTSWEEVGTSCLLGYGFYGAYPGHAWYGCGLQSTDRLDWENSWGDGWGSNGFGTASRSRLTFQYGIYMISDVTIPTPLSLAA